MRYTAVKAEDEEQEKLRNRPLGSYKYMIVDAIYEKERSDGCVVDAAVLIAYGINSNGQREVPGISVSLSDFILPHPYTFKLLSTFPTKLVKLTMSW